MTLRTSQIERFKGQPRTYFDENGINQLAESIKAIGQKSPVIVKDCGDGKYELIDGERRLRACIKANILKINAVVVSGYMNGQQHLDSLTLNFHKENHTHKEIFMALAKEVANGRSVQDLMLVLGKSTTWVYSYLSFQKLIPELQEILEHESRSNDCLRYGEAVMLARVDDHAAQKSIFDQVKELPPNQRKSRLKKLVQAQRQPQQRKVRTKDAKDYRKSLEAFFDRLTAGSEMILDMPSKMLKAVVKETAPDLKKMWWDDITTCIENLEVLRDSLG